MRSNLKNEAARRLQDFIDAIDSGDRMSPADILKAMTEISQKIDPMLSEAERRYEAGDIPIEILTDFEQKCGVLVAKTFDAAIIAHSGQSAYAARQLANALTEINQGVPDKTGENHGFRSRVKPQIHDTDTEWTRARVIAAARYYSSTSKIHSHILRKGAAKLGIDKKKIKKLVDNYDNEILRTKRLKSLVNFAIDELEKGDRTHFIDLLPKGF